MLPLDLYWAWRDAGVLLGRIISILHLDRCSGYSATNIMAKLTYLLHNLGKNSHQCHLEGYGACLSIYAGRVLLHVVLLCMWASQVHYSIGHIDVRRKGKVSDSSRQLVTRCSLGHGLLPEAGAGVRLGNSFSNLAEVETARGVFSRFLWSLSAWHGISQSRSLTLLYRLGLPVSVLVRGPFQQATRVAARQHLTGTVQVTSRYITDRVDQRHQKQSMLLKLHDFVHGS